MTEDEISEANLINIDEKTDVIEWTGSQGFGRITIKYLNNGTYSFDSEYLSLIFVINILKKVKL